MKCLVTGGAGFIGSNLVEQLVDADHEVIVIDNESSDAHEHPHWHKKTQNHKLDIMNYPAIEPLFKGVDWVFHLAAEARIQPAINNPIHATAVNVVGTCHVLQAARTHGVKRVMYSSTSAAYGLTSVIPQHESLPRDCLNPYSVSKCSGEDLCQMYTRLFGVPTITFRYFNVYGKNQPIRGQYAPVIGVFFRQVGAGEPMTIVGTGTRRRDYVCVTDVARANIAAANASDGIGEIFNIGTGVSYSVNEVAQMIGGKSIHIADRLGEAESTQADITRARNILGWQPTVSLKEWIKANRPLLSKQ